AGIDTAVGDVPADRRAHRGEFDIEAARTHARLGRRQPGLCRVHPRLQSIDLTFGDGIVVHQPLRPVAIALGQSKVAPRSGDTGFRFGEGSAIRPGIDREQRLPLAYDLTVTKMHRSDLTRD